MVMKSKAPRSGIIRKYYIALEELVDTYKEIIMAEYHENFIIKENNEIRHREIVGFYVIKERVFDKSGYKYIYKIGITANLKLRMNVYNTSVANNVKLVYFVQINNRKQIENCVKFALQNFQYRKNKEFYECTIARIIKTIKACNQFYNYEILQTAGVYRLTGRKSLFIDDNTDFNKSVLIEFELNEENNSDIVQTGGATLTAIQEEYIAIQEFKLLYNISIIN
jgi:hypothetical protein